MQTQEFALATGTVCKRGLIHRFRAASAAFFGSAGPQRLAPDRAPDGFDLPVHARPAMPGLFGGLEEELKTKVDFETAQAFRRLCAEAGTNAAGGLRQWIYFKVHGRTYDDLVAEAANRRTRQLIGTGQEQGLNGVREGAQS